MPARSRGKSLTLAGSTAPSADAAPPAPAPAPAPREAPAPVSDIASLQASNIGHTQDADTLSVDDFISGRPDPDLDLVTTTVRVPRYLAEALRLNANMTKRPAQYTVADGLRAVLPAALVARCRAKVERG